VMNIDGCANYEAGVFVESVFVKQNFTSTFTASLWCNWKKKMYVSFLVCETNRHQRLELKFCRSHKLVEH